MRISDWSSDVCSSDLAELTVAAAHGDHAQLALERHEGFEDQPDGPGLRAERLPGGVGGGTCFGPDAELPLAVVAQSPGLEDARRADRGDRGVEYFARGDIGELRDRDAGFVEQGLLRQAVLDQGQDRKRTRLNSSH